MNEYADLVAKETCLPRPNSVMEAGATVKLLEELIFAADSTLRSETIESPGQKAHIRREPFGVVFSIAPWNGPLILGTRSFADAIVCRSLLLSRPKLKITYDVDSWKHRGPQGNAHIPTRFPTSA